MRHYAQLWVTMWYYAQSLVTMWYYSIPWVTMGYYAQSWVTMWYYAISWVTMWLYAQSWVTMWYYAISRATLWYYVIRTWSLSVVGEGGDEEGLSVDNHDRLGGHPVHSTQSCDLLRLREVQALGDLHVSKVHLNKTEQTLFAYRANAGNHL